jgi:NAD(P)-dependent dehydrogenase (short-subunit alcohol dehydrogenase family)
MAGSGRLSGKKALVTGASRGIGRSIALRFAAEGATVCAGVRTEADGQELAADAARQGLVLLPVVLDVVDAASVATGVERASRPDRRLDIVVNNAGIGGITPLAGDERSDSLWRKILDVNVTGTWRVLRAAHPFLADGGRILNLSSVTGRFGVAGSAAYATSKHAVIGLTRSLALELAPRRITVNALCPGWVDTDMGRDGIGRVAKESGLSADQAFEMAGRMAPLGAVLTPDEIGGLAVYLASDEARNVTGQAIVIDGGQVMP